MKTLVILSTMLFSINGYTCPNIIGTWQSSKELSIEYNRETLDLEPHTIKFMHDVLGVLKITYTQDFVHMHSAPTKTIDIKGESHDFIYEEATFKYKIDSCNKDTLFISDEHPYSQSNNDPIIFIDEDTFWVPTEPGSEMREYFVRSR